MQPTYPTPIPLVIEAALENQLSVPDATIASNATIGSVRTSHSARPSATMVPATGCVATMPDTIKQQPSTRLYFIVARRAPVAVVFRRGPSRQVELLTWNLATDEITPGQWLKGRIYERRCDLSPDGSLLIYFAAKYETGLRTWTAISKPPYLTALTLWPKGDAWGGGGLFNSARRIRLNHKPDEMKMAPDFRLGSSMEVVPIGEWAGHGEDDPIHGVRLERDGWRWSGEESESREHGQRSRRWITFEPPIRYRKAVSRAPGGVELEMSIEAIHERQGAWYVITYRLVAGEDVILDLGRLDWVDVGPQGELLFAGDGRLSRLTHDDQGRWRSGETRTVIDLSNHRFESRIAPDWAQRW